MRWCRALTLKARLTSDASGADGMRREVDCGPMCRLISLALWGAGPLCRLGVLT
jgi:hypothetical protein